MAHVPAWLKRHQILIESRLTPLALRARRLGIEATHLSLAQAPLVVVTAFLIVRGDLLLAAGALLSSLVLDLLDGFYARATGTQSRAGHVADKAMDLFGIAVLVGAIWAVRPDLWMPLLAAGAATGVLYALGWLFDPELVTGVRAAGMAWLVAPWAAWLLWLPAIAGVAQIPLAVAWREPKQGPPGQATEE